VNRILRLLSGFLSACILSLILATINYNSFSNREPNVLYNDFMDIFMLNLMYFLPAYLLLGVPTSLLIQKLMKKRESGYLSHLLLYIVSGGILCIPYIFVVTKGELPFLELFKFFIWGLVASTLYYHIYLLLSLLVKKKKKLS
jgi:hypothetical protein